MTQEASELLKRALELPASERAELAGNLLDSLDTEVDEDVDAAWQREIARRMDEISSGAVKPVPWTEVRRKAQALLHGR